MFTENKNHSFGQFFSLFTALCSVILAASANAFDFEYIIQDESVIITEYTGSDEDVIVPGTIEDLPVTVIGQWAFSRNNDLIHVTLPETITSIGMEAFSYCRNLESVLLGDSLREVEGYAFYGCNRLLEINLPETVTTIGDYAFAGCLSLTQMILPPEVTTLEKGTFFECSNLETVFIGNAVTELKEKCFERCSSLLRIHIPAAVQTIAEDAFTYCSSLEEFTVDTDNENFMAPDGSLCNKELDTLYFCPGGKEGTYDLPAQITTIGAGAFLGCIHLTDFNVDSENPNFSSVEGILYNKEGTILLVYPAGRLGPQIIPDGTVVLADHSFNSCAQAPFFIFPATLTYIGSHAFWYCSSLTSLGFNGNAPETIDDIFYGTSSLLMIYSRPETTGWEKSFSGHTVRANSVDQIVTLNELKENILPYGSRDFTLSAKSDASFGLNYYSTDPNVATTQRYQVHITGAGVTTFYAYQTGGSRNQINYFPAISNPVTLTVTPLEATITVESLEQPCDEIVEPFGYEVEGLINGDTLQGQPIYLVGGVALEDLVYPLTPGLYPLSVGGLYHNGYNIQIIEGTLNALPVKDPEVAVKDVVKDEFGNVKAIILTFSGTLQISKDDGATWEDLMDDDSADYRFETEGSPKALFRAVVNR